MDVEARLMRTFGGIPNKLLRLGKKSEVSVSCPRAGSRPGEERVVDAVFMHNGDISSF